MDESETLAARTDGDGRQRGGGRPTAKKYPIRCIECGKGEARPANIDWKARRNHDGQLYDLVVRDLPVVRCDACDSVFFTEESDDLIAAALREHLALLAPGQIRANIEGSGLSQEDAARRLGVAPETLSRWLSGAVIQPRAMDDLLRTLFAAGAEEKP